jgi:exosortase A
MQKHYRWEAQLLPLSPCSARDSPGGGMTAMAPSKRASSNPGNRRLAHTYRPWPGFGRILALFGRDVADIVAIWWNASTYNHCALVPPIIAWLVWQRAPELRQLRPNAWWPGLVWSAEALRSGCWEKQAASRSPATQDWWRCCRGAVIACLGQTVARALMFPIFYAVFLIPAGEELVPLLQTVTAYMCMALLGLVGIPAHIEGIFITTPDGYFEVAEACSGVKFLVAMVAYGALVANVCFRSWPRAFCSCWRRSRSRSWRTAFARWGTIYIASVTGSEFASDFDHVVYGWIFFAVVIALLMAAGWRFFDRKPGDPWFDPRTPERI